jgi:hypothetical protein
MNLTLVSEFQTIQRRPFELAAPALLKPNDANPLVDGEFLELDGSYKMARGVGVAAVPSYAVFAERGRYDTQTIGKVPMLYLGAYEADTLIFDGTGIVSAGQALEVGDVTIGGLVKRGLKLATIGLVVGYVSRLPAANNNKLRFTRA